MGRVLGAYCWRRLAVPCAAGNGGPRRHGGRPWPSYRCVGNKPAPVVCTGLMNRQTVCVCVCVCVCTRLVCACAWVLARVCSLACVCVSMGVWRCGCAAMRARAREREREHARVRVRERERERTRACASAGEGVGVLDLSKYKRGSRLPDERTLSSLQLGANHTGVALPRAHVCL